MYLFADNCVAIAPYQLRRASGPLQFLLIN